MQVENNYLEHMRSSEALMHVGRAVFHMVYFLLNMGKIWSKVELYYCSLPQQPCKARYEESFPLYLGQPHSQLHSWDLSQCQTKCLSNAFHGDLQLSVPQPCRMVCRGNSWQALSRAHCWRCHAATGISRAAR